MLKQIEVGAILISAGIVVPVVVRSVIQLVLACCLGYNPGILANQRDMFQSSLVLSVA